MAETEGARPVRVWDLPTRVFHWGLVALLLCSFVTGELGELDWHFVSGEAVLALLVFRVLWGVFGSETARFGAFLRGPGAVWRYLRGGDGVAAVGHSPVGGWAVAALLGVLCAQVGTGLFADDDVSSEGPLAHLVRHATSRQITAWHHRTFWLLLGLAGLHVTAIVVYRVVRRQDLVGPMVSGVKVLPGRVAAPLLRSVWWAVGALAVGGAVAWWVASVGE